MGSSSPSLGHSGREGMKQQCRESREGRGPRETIGFLSGRERRAPRNRAGLRALCQIATDEFCHFLLG